MRSGILLGRKIFQWKNYKIGFTRYMKKIAIIGQGYVGLPLAIEFSQFFPVVGYDTNPWRIREIEECRDKTLEADLDKLKKALSLYKESESLLGYMPTSDWEDLEDAQIYIITVPTPIDQYNSPDLSHLIGATELVARVLKKGDIVIYESTVYPGCTEEECVPVLARGSKLIYNQDFYVGYSPERIVPGDKVHTLTTIVKVTSGSNSVIAEEIDQLYNIIIKAGTHKASSIKVAEASKAIENAQRDVNISFVNELALIFDRMGIDTTDVLNAAGTKFNFLKYKPGLVGGHCISVDPYYLVHKAVKLGYHPAVILSGRRVNDSVPEFIASKVVKLMIRKDIQIKYAKVLILGVSFKENCPDLRNTKVIDVYKALTSYGMDVDIFDPWVNVGDMKELYGLNLVHSINIQYDAVILAVAHKEFLEMKIETYLKEKSILYDLKACLDRSLVDARL